MPAESKPRAPPAGPPFYPTPPWLGKQRLPACLGLWLFLQLPFLGSGTQVAFRALEEQPPGTLLGSLSAEYGFLGMGYLYKLEEGAPYLRVDGKTGDLYAAETPIDRESLPECRWLWVEEPCYLEFAVSVTELLSNSARLLEGRIEVLDINDNPPRFESPVIDLAVPENSIIGAVFPAPLAADPDAGDNRVASYQLMPGSDGQKLFALRVAEDQEEKMPQLIVMGNLDRELVESYNLTVQARDGGQPPLTGSALLHITILDQNDNAPQFEKPLYEAELSENSRVGHHILQVKAKDPDQGANAEIDYSFHWASDVVRQLLWLNRTTGLITVCQPVDREDVKVLKFSVLAKDRGAPQKTSRAQVVISIRDMMLNAPAVEIHDKIFQYIDEHQNEYVQRLKDWVAIESDSSDPLKRNLLINMTHVAAEWIKQLGGTVELAELGVQELSDGSTIRLPPVILANIRNNPQKPTVCFYGHLDVQLAKLEDGWSTEPYILTERNGGMLKTRHAFIQGHLGA